MSMLVIPSPGEDHIDGLVGSHLRVGSLWSLTYEGSHS